MKWSPRLLVVLLEELHVGNEIVQLVGDPRRVERRRYPHAVAVALALRHSWRPDDLQRLVRRLRLPSRPGDTRAFKQRRRDSVGLT